MAAPSLVPPPRRSPSEWAESELRVQDGPRAGQPLRLFAFQREIVDSLGSDDVQEVAVMGSAQWGKTMALLVSVGWMVAEDPCRALYVMPSSQGDGGALNFSRERVAPMIASTPVLRERVASRRESGGSNTAGSKTFVGGSIAFVGATSPAGLASRPSMRVYFDEVDRFPRALGRATDRHAGGPSAGEGSPLDVARKRTETFGSRRLVAAVSTPVDHGGPIHSAYLAGDQRRYIVECPACGEKGILGWQGVEVDLRLRDAEDRPIGPPPPPVIAAVQWSRPDGSDAALVCRECEHVWSEMDRAWAVDLGHWQPDREAPPGWRSYHIWAAYSPLSRLPSLAADWIAAVADAAAGDTGPLTTFRQTALGLPVREDDIVSGDVEQLRAALLASREGPDTWGPPADVRIVGSVDVHSDRLELLVSAWSGTDAWLLDHVVIGGSVADDHTWSRLTTAVAESGAAVVNVDSGWAAERVYEWVAEDIRIRRAVKGYAGPRRLVGPRRDDASSAGRRARVRIIGVDEGKRRVMAMLESGRMHLPRAPWCGVEFVSQLTSEVETTARLRGRTVRTWTPVRRRNEALDLCVYALHAALTLR